MPTGRAAAGALLAALLWLALGAALARANVPVGIVSGDPYHNTTSFHATEVEPDTFAAGSTLVSAFQAGRFFDGGASNIGWATTTDAGAGYSRGFLPGTTIFARPSGRFSRVTDPSVAYDARHATWMVNSLGLIVGSGTIHGAAVIVNRSTDGGLSWSTPVTVRPAGPGQDFDKNWIACDNTPTSPHYGNCYVEWDDFGNGNQLHMAFSSDGGASWTQSVVPANASVIGGQPLVQPNGTVVVPIDDAFGSVVESFVSANGGVGYSGPYSIAAIDYHVEAGNLRSEAMPTAEIDHAGRIYVAWPDCRFIAGCAGNDIVFSTSTDGKSWSAVKRVPIDAATSGHDNFLPGLAVDRATSGTTARLALTYYFYPQSSCTTTTCALEVGFTGSTDGGANWSAPLRLSGPVPLSELASTDQGVMVGDYLSTSFVAGSTGSAALPVFALGLPVSGKTCTLGDVTSCKEPMVAPKAPLSLAAGTRPALAGPVLSRPPARQRPRTRLQSR